MDKNSKEQPEYNEGPQIPIVLAEDFRQMAALKDSMDKQCFRRLLARTAFSILEAFVNYLKSRALTAALHGEISFNPKELKILSEGEEIIKDDGSKKWEFRRPGMKNNLKTALSAYAKARNTETPLSGLAPLPQEFGTALNIRNRITHPKRLHHLLISDEEILAFWKIMQWFLEVHQWASEQEIKYIDAKEEKMHNSYAESIERIKSDLKPK